MTTITSPSSADWQQNQEVPKVNPEQLRDREEIGKLAEEFESIFLGIMLKSMRDSIPKSDFISGGNGEEIFRSMLDTEYAKSMATQRNSGLADSIERHLLGLMANKDNVATPTQAIAQYKKVL